MAIFVTFLLIFSSMSVWRALWKESAYFMPITHTSQYWVTEMSLDLTLRNLSVMTGRTRGTRNDVGSVVVCSRCCSVAVVASARWHQVVAVHQCTRVSGGYSAPENLSIRCCSTTVSANKAKHRLHQVLQCTRELHQVATERLVPNTCLTARHDSPKPDPPTDNK